MLVALVVAIIGGRLYERHAPRRALDIPNARSSHTRPTPRGGGLVIVAGFLAGIATWLALGGTLSPRASGWLAGALLVASVSFVDDLRSLAAAPRFITHLIGAAILTLAGVQAPDLAVPLAFLYVIALTNVYNFMDGIDGLAASQAVIAGLGLAVAGQIVANPVLALGGGLLAAGSAGFLRYNLPPAHLFMGDVGSTFLGFSFSGLSLLGNIGVGGGRLPLEFGLLLLAPFWFDSAATLIRRFARGERWYAAHRSHYYQRLVACGWSHGQVTSLYAGVGVVAAGAALASLMATDLLRPALAALAYAPMLGAVALVWRLERAEQPNEPSAVVTQGQG
jgi:UDP-N-acetylmuramyl pentapeptide phosphotransferase/UDP-N-acetylglucosamine-1-phosphate transferase